MVVILTSIVLMVVGICRVYIVLNLVKFPLLCYLDLFLLAIFYGLGFHGMNSTILHHHLG